MKRLFVTLAIALSFIGLSSFSDSDNVTSKVLESFKSSFKNATEVSWVAMPDFYKANFTLDGEYVSAFYSFDGRMIALTRYISPAQLPLTLQNTLKKDYEQYWVSDLFEYADDGGTTYYVTLENKDAKIVLKSASSTSWTQYQKERK